MLAAAKVFTNGNSQAIRLPKAFRTDVDEMWIARNEATGEMDTQIAAHALALGLPLVTHNTRHFKRMLGLKLEDWMV
jgi:predicted nucleic acid-binding protein